ncbi:hypothetical protein HYPSUDRAFT_140777 [Hypholoma sublateritium FD-334 SS-4]|uniref:Mid2 domain-containing protein n=1 Tax=Hypholoma sublateritium (strain FD-334 SS-4) TaxID=945553 RepID=A0A0D2MCW9_HYPSF|nr:hypothetical protein HYPSUDRAFT_140777 [Hypholoma sublateritium FD-334 SS-4]
MVPGAHLFSLLFTTVVLHGVHAYTWSYQGTPTQCNNLTVAISGSDGTPPFRILISPFGPSPLANNVEARNILDIPFPDNQTEVQFQLTYPAGSQFVAVVSDATSFASGGTGVATMVAASNDTSCYSSIALKFFFNIEPPNQLVQCQPMRIWWDPSAVQGTPNFLGVIPGGQSFAVPEGTLTTVPSQGLGFTWIPSLRAGTTLALMGGDARGNGTAGRIQNVVSLGTSDVESCLSDSSPSSTPGTPAGGSYPTSTSGTGTGNTSKISSNARLIAAAIAGGLAVFIIGALILFFLRRRSRQHRYKARHVNIIDVDEDDVHDSTGAVRQNELPRFYKPSPLPLADLTSDSGSAYSSWTPPSTPYTAASSSGTFSIRGTNGGKGVPRPVREVHYVQHDDAGPSVLPPREDAQEPQTIELPPAYTALQRAKGADESDRLLSAAGPSNGRRALGDNWQPDRKVAR